MYKKHTYIGFWAIYFSLAILSFPASALSQSQLPSLRIALTAAFVSESAVHVYDEIAQYLGKKINRDVTFVTGLSYSTVNEMIDDNVIDIAFVCGLPYTLKSDKDVTTVQLLAAPVMRSARYLNKPIYFSDVIVNKDSELKTFEDLRGKVFVYNDVISNSGYNMPRAYLISINETKGFFSKVIRSGSHEESIRMVATGKADASAIDSLVLDYDRLHNNKFALNVRVVKVLGPSAIPPVIISNKLDSSLIKDIQNVLLDMHNTEAGKKILDSAGVKHFTEMSNEHYDDIRKMKKLAEQTGFTHLK